jgi:hypothetical protein
MRRWIIAAALCIGTLYSPSASSTIATHRNDVAGCVMAGQFVPYASQRRAAVKLPYWVGKSGGKDLEGREIRLIWLARVTDREIPNYVFERNAARWEVVGACDRSRLPAPGDGGMKTSP